MGGDEFVILCEGCSSEDAMRTARRILGSLGATICVSGHEIHVAASIGIAIGKNGTNPSPFSETLMFAMYRAKDTDAAIEIYDKEMRRIALARINAEDRLCPARSINILSSLIINLSSSSPLWMFSARRPLARWTDADIGVVPPTIFVPLAEDTGLIGPLGLQILTTACGVATTWPSPLTPVSVNVSARQICDPDFAEAIEAVLRDANLEPNRLFWSLPRCVYGTAEPQH